MLPVFVFLFRASSDQNSRCAIGQTMRILIIVRSRKITKSSRMFTGSLDPSIKPPTSSRKSTWVMEITATMNFVISAAPGPEMMMAGVNISVNPTTIVDTAAFVFDGDHEDHDPDDRRDEKARHQFCSVFIHVTFLGFFMRGDYIIFGEYN